MICAESTETQSIGRTFAEQNRLCPAKVRGGRGRAPFIFHRGRDQSEEDAWAGSAGVDCMPRTTVEMTGVASVEAHKSSWHPTGTSAVGAEHAAVPLALPLVSLVRVSVVSERVACVIRVREFQRDSSPTVKTDHKSNVAAALRCLKAVGVGGVGGCLYPHKAARGGSMARGARVRMGKRRADLDNLRGTGPAIILVIYCAVLVEPLRVPLGCQGPSEHCSHTTMQQLSAPLTSI